jgi:ribonuclease PH
MTDLSRPDGRADDQLRPLSFAPGIAPHAHGSVLARFGNTAVICAAMLEDKVPPWMTQQRVPGGWLSAEYSLLPYSTLERKPREVTRGKQEGRTMEIQRLIGRALRAVVDLQKLPGFTLWLDCDVLQADGGTRTAAISGAYVAARLAVRRLLTSGKLAADPFRDSVAAVSAGVWRGRPILDLNYIEDRDAEVDANIVLTGSGHFVEVQSAGEEATFSSEELASLIVLARKGASEITAAQAAALA